MNQDLIRHIVINTIRDINLKFRNKYGNLVLAADSKKYWRRAVFPHYKASRKRIRDTSKIDWERIFKHTSVFKEELQNYFPYKYIEVEGAEADDIIGVSCLFSGIEEDILIISSDKDYLQ